MRVEKAIRFTASAVGIAQRFRIGAARIATTGRHGSTSPRQKGTARPTGASAAERGTRRVPDSRSPAREARAGRRAAGNRLRAPTGLRHLAPTGPSSGGPPPESSPMRAAAG
eukprot:7164302-Alexandrium_andersonii.AAC.1